MYAYDEPVDMRNSFNTLSAIVSAYMGKAVQRIFMAVSWASYVRKQGASVFRQIVLLVGCHNSNALKAQGFWQGAPSTGRCLETGLARVWMSRYAVSMSMVPLQFLILTVAGWMRRHELSENEYLKEQVKVLLELQGGKRPKFTDGQRRRLARLAKKLGRKKLFELPNIVTPDTLLG